MNETQEQIDKTTDQKLLHGCFLAPFFFSHYHKNFVILYFQNRKNHKKLKEACLYDMPFDMNCRPCPVRKTNCTSLSDCCDMTESISNTDDRRE